MSDRKEHHLEDGVLLLHGEALEVLKTLPDNSMDAVVTDPPYGLSNTAIEKVNDTIRSWVNGDKEEVPKGKGFMGKDWDGFVPPPAIWEECMRVLKPGGHMAVFAGARTQDLMGLSIRLAGFEIRDTLGWIYGSGFPKSMDLSKAIDKGQGSSMTEALEFTEWMRSTGITASAINEATGTFMGSHYLTDKQQPAVAKSDQFDKLRPLLPEVPERIERLVAGGIDNYSKREVIGKYQSGLHTGSSGVGGNGEGGAVTTPATDDAKKWSGWGTALKPAIEPIILARKPLDGTVANNVLSHGVGGLNIDATRVGTDVRINQSAGNKAGGASFNMSAVGMPENVPGREATGRFPANVLLDEHAATEMDKQSGIAKPKHARTGKRGGSAWHGSEGIGSPDKCGHWPEDAGGGASRFFPVFKYQAKAPKKERPVVEREDGTKIQHPTVKPVGLMEWLVTLITPPGGTVLDPFTGSGTTLEAAKAEGFNSVGIEMGEEYILLIEERFRKRRERLEDNESES